MKLDRTKTNIKYNNYSGLPSRFSSWKVSSKAGIASDFATLLRIKQGENENNAIRNRISDFDKQRISQPKPNKQTSHE